MKTKVSFGKTMMRALELQQVGEKAHLRTKQL